MTRDCHFKSRATCHMTSGLLKVAKEKFLCYNIFIKVRKYKERKRLRNAEVLHCRYSFWT